MFTLIVVILYYVPMHAMALLLLHSYTTLNDSLSLFPCFFCSNGKLHSNTGNIALDPTSAYFSIT